MAFFDFLHALTSRNQGGQKSALTLSNGLGVNSLDAAAKFGNMQPAQPTTLNAAGLTLDSSPYGQTTFDNSGSVQGGSTTDTSTLQPAAQLTQYQTDVRNRINQLNGIYNSLYGGVDKTVSNQYNLANQNYNQQLNDLQNQYGNTEKQQAYMYGARGLGSSSYAQDAQDQAANTLNESIANIGQNRQNTLGQLGQYAASTKAGFGANQKQFDSLLNNLGNYSLTDLQNYRDQLDSAIQGAQSQLAGLGTNQDFINGLNKIAPVKDQGTATLASMLQKLVTSSAPAFAKKQIAQGLITQSQLTDKNAQNYWQNYFQNLLSQNGQGTPTA